MTLSAWVSGVGVWSPAMPSWAAARTRLTSGSASDVDAPASDGKPPPANWLPPNERRRATLGTRLVLSVAQEALTQASWNAAQVPSVFASSSGSPEITDELCSMLAAGDTRISPTRFHNSVHNAAAGYYSIAVACRRASTSIGAFDASAATGLLEAFAQLGAEDDAEGLADGGEDTGLLFVSFDLPYTGPLAVVRPVREAWGVALALSRAPAPSSVARLELSWRVDGNESAREPPRAGAANAESFESADETRCADAMLEPARLGNPTARLLPLLEALAGSSGRQVLLAANGGHVAVDVFPR